MIKQLDGIVLVGNWFGYPAQKRSVHLSQAYTRLGDTKSARAEQEAAEAPRDALTGRLRAQLTEALSV
ncbi:hypothetical protein ACIQGO_38450 [Streptomyces shenzhenensis]|uniref:hypothetical protein n=1 Tax=Streptomyces shenzhenensis TaxID=943815 RepID=UPI0038277C1F